jgi:hypothetical protein
MLERLETSGPWWRGSEALNVTETNHVKGHIGNTTIGEICNGENRASRRNKIILQRRLHERFTGGELWCDIHLLVPEAHPGLYVFCSYILLYSLLFIFCLQVDKDGITEML